MTPTELERMVDKALADYINDLEKQLEIARLEIEQLNAMLDDACSYYESSDRYAEEQEWSGYNEEEEDQGYFNETS